MRIGLATMNLYNLGGGYSAVFWHLVAMRDLGHDVTCITKNKPHPVILNNWISGIPIRGYSAGMEQDFDVVINVDHMNWSLPLAKHLNLAHVFFPGERPPPDNVKLYANSKYTAEHVRYKWGRECETLYIPIKQGFYESQKENMILHVSRITEPTWWADKGHRQMIQVFRMYANELTPNGWRMVFAGALDPDQDSYLQELYVTGAGLPIEFVHNPTDQQLFDLYAKAAVYWHATGVSLPTIPSAQEHLGLTPLEASASGCVPIVYRSGGMPEVVQEGQTGLLFDDVRELGQFTMQLALDWSAWSYLSQKGKRWAAAWQDYPAFMMRVDAMLKGDPIPELPFAPDKLKFRPEDVTVLIPTLDSPTLEACLKALKETAPNIRVIVLNNGNDLPEWWSQYPEWTEVLFGENRGFAGALKSAEDMLETPLVLVFNDDVVAKRAGWLEALLFELNSQDVGVVGPKLLFQDGSLQHAGGAIDWNRQDVGYHRWYTQPDHVAANQRAEVPFVTGAAMLLRRELFHVEDYLLDGLNMEDTDMCLRAKQKGYQTIYQPVSDLFHLESSTKVRLPESEDKIRLNRGRFIDKWGIGLGNK